MKRQSFIFLSLVVAMLSLSNVRVSATPVQIPLEVGYVDPNTDQDGRHRGPVQPPIVYIEDGTLTFDANHADYVFTLLDEDGEEVYTAIVPSAVTIVQLPSTLTGLHEIQLYPGGDYYFTGDIVL